MRHAGIVSYSCTNAPTRIPRRGRRTTNGCPWKQGRPRSRHEARGLQQLPKCREKSPTSECSSQEMLVISTDRTFCFNSNSNSHPHTAIPVAGIPTTPVRVYFKAVPLISPLTTLSCKMGPASLQTGPRGSSHVVAEPIRQVHPLSIYPEACRR